MRGSKRGELVSGGREREAEAIHRTPDRLRRAGIRRLTTPGGREELRQNRMSSLERISGRDEFLRSTQGGSEMPDAEGAKESKQFYLDRPFPREGFFLKGAGGLDWGMKNRCPLSSHTGPFNSA